MQFKGSSDSTGDTLVRIVSPYPAKFWRVANPECVSILLLPYYPSQQPWITINSGWSCLRPSLAYHQTTFPLKVKLPFPILIGKDSDAGRDLGAGGEGDDRGWDGWMASLTRWTESEWTPGVGDGQGGLACCDSCGHKESDTTEWLIWSDLIQGKQISTC